MMHSDTPVGNGSDIILLTQLRDHLTVNFVFVFGFKVVLLWLFVWFCCEPWRSTYKSRICRSQKILSMHSLP